MKILVVDDHPLIQDSAAALLQKIDPQAVLLRALTLADTLRQLEAEQGVDLVLLDLQLPDSSGLDGLVAIKDLYPSTSVVVLSATEDPELILAALNKGASGYIPKSSAPGTLCGAIELVIRHKTVYVPLQALGVQSRLAPVAPGANPSEGASDSNAILAELGITGRARDVFERLIEAKPLKVIARELDMAESTVKAHAKTIYIALRTRNRAETLVKVAQLGITFKREPRTSSPDRGR